MGSEARRRTRRLACAALLWLAPAAAHALPRAEPVPGGLAIVTLGDAARPAPRVEYAGKRVLVVAEAGRWHALVGLPLSAAPGSHNLHVHRAGSDEVVRFEVRDKTYETQHITLKNQRQVDPLPADLERIERDQARSRAAFAVWSERPAVATAFLPPVAGAVSGTFGKRRVFNGQPRQPHSGIDLAAGPGTPVRAPAVGRVVEVGDYFFNGNTVFIDHGQGLVTMFCHLESYAVAVGDEVAAGQIFARVGATGRATGPHLHWSVSLNDSRVDPTLFLPVAAER